jgi:hypothetical protein
MDIEDAFTTEAIEATDTNVEGDEETELRRVIQRIYETNEMEHTRDQENVAVLMFVGGRTYQAANQRLRVDMTPEMVGEFLEFLVQRGAL